MNTSELEIRAVDLLRSEFNSRTLLNESYSMRAFARDIGLSSSMLCELFNGKRRLSPRKAQLIASRLKLSRPEKDFFVSLVNKESSRKPNQQNPTSFEASRSLTLDGFKLISDWYYYSILCAMELDQYDGSVEFIADYLGLDVRLINSAIETLARLDLVEITPNGPQCKEADVTTTNDIASLGLRNFHKQLLHRAIEAVENIPVEKRDITSMTMSIDKNKLPEAKKMIRKFRRDLCKFLETGKKNSVFSLNIQLFPHGGENQ